MDRRELLKNMLTLTCGTLWLPAISFSCAGTAEVEGLDISEIEKKLVYHICEVIIPSEEKTKGAHDLLLGDFVMLMVADCRTPDDQQRFLKGLRSLQTVGTELMKKEPRDFAALDWEHFLIKMEKIKEDATRDTDVGSVKYCVSTIKNLTIQGFTTSKYFMTEIMPYEMFPGGFKGKVEIHPGEKVNIYG